MTKNEILFDKVFKKQGGIIDPEYLKTDIFLSNFKKSIDKRLESASAMFPNVIIPKIYFNFIKNNSLNASVWKENDTYFIGFHIGTYYLLWDLFMKMFSSRDILPHIGNSKTEIDEKKVVNAIKKGNSITYEMHDKNNISIPKDPLRIEYAQYFSGEALKLLFNHEFCHIIRGHVDYLCKGQNKFNFEELQSNDNNSSLDVLIRQTLEMDADSFATNHAVIDGIIFIGHENLGSQQRFKKFFIDWKSYISNWAFITYSLFRLLGFENTNKNNNHPPPIVRMLMTTQTLATILILKKDELNGESVHSLMPVVQQAIFDAEDAFTKVTFHNNSIESWISVNEDEETDKYIDKIVANWNKVHPLIKPFAYAPIPPLRK